VREHGLTIVAGGDPEPETPTTPGTVSVDYEVSRQGSRGAWVKMLQEALGVDADGIFGAGTDAALKAYQKQEGLTADGVAGRSTYKALGLIS